MVDSLFNYSLLSSLLIKDLEIPVILEKEFTVQCCITGYHTYQSQWYAEVGAELGAVPHTRTTALVKDKYAIAVKNGEQTVGHIPMSLSKLTFLFLRYDGKVSIKVSGPRKYSVDLIQGGLELPAEFTFQTSNEKLFSQMQEETMVEIEKFEEKRKKMEDEMKKKKKKSKIDKNKQTNKKWINNGNRR